MVCLEWVLFCVNIEKKSKCLDLFELICWFGVVFCKKKLKFNINSVDWLF